GSAPAAASADDTSAATPISCQWSAAATTRLRDLQLPTRSLRPYRAKYNRLNKLGLGGQEPQGDVGDRLPSGGRPPESQSLDETKVQRVYRRVQQRIAL